MLKGVLGFGAAFGGVVLGELVADRFVIKYGPNDPYGFIEAADGFGKDELIRAGCAVLGILALTWIARKVGG
jgi:hypothetical protein